MSAWSGRRSCRQSDQQTVGKVELEHYEEYFDRTDLPLSIAQGTKGLLDTW